MWLVNNVPKIPRILYGVKLGLHGDFFFGKFKNSILKIKILEKTLM
jgi:hypothetical protein